MQDPKPAVASAAYGCLQEAYGSVQTTMDLAVHFEEEAPRQKHGVWMSLGHLAAVKDGPVKRHGLAGALAVGPGVETEVATECRLYVRASERRLGVRARWYDVPSGVEVGCAALEAP